jgi:hypothetical protein
MFKKLFGDSKKPEAGERTSNGVFPEAYRNRSLEAMGMLSKTAAAVELRIKKKENEINAFKTEAHTKKEAKYDEGKRIEIFLSEIFSGY